MECSIIFKTVVMKNILEDNCMSMFNDVCDEY